MDGILEIVSSMDDIAKFIGYSALGCREQAYAEIGRILSNPIEDISRSFNYVVFELLKTYSLKQGMYESVVSKLGNKVLKVFRLVSEQWVQDSFKDEYLLASFLYTFVDLCRVS